MITYLSHWDWILYKSRKDLIGYFKNYEISAMSPSGEYSEKLEEIYKNFYPWEINRNKLLDIKAIISLRKIINNYDTNFHCFTLKTGIIFSIANLFVGKHKKAVLSITGLGYLFSDNVKAKFLKLLVKPFIKYLFNKSFSIIIFQNSSDKKIFLKFSGFANKTTIIYSSGIETSNFKIRNTNRNNNKKIKIILISRLLYDKGILDFLSLVNDFNNEKFKFYLAGERDEGNPQNINNEDMDKILNTNNLEYLGEINIEDKLSEFDISIVMSFHEGFSRILLESLYVGLYCLAYKIQGTEVMGNFENLELINLDNTQKFKQYIENYKGVLNNDHNTKLINDLYSSKVVASKFENLYKDLEKSV